MPLVGWLPLLGGVAPEPVGSVVADKLSQLLRGGCGLVLGVPSRPRREGPEAQRKVCNQSGCRTAAVHVEVGSTLLMARCPLRAGCVDVALGESRRRLWDASGAVPGTKPDCLAHLGASRPCSVDWLIRRRGKTLGGFRPV